MDTVILQQPHRLLFGCGSAQSIPGELAAAGLRRAFVVTSTPVVASSAVASLCDAWRASGLALEIAPLVDREPEIALFETVLAVARVFRPDVVIGLGGGSPLDVAKLTAALLDGVQDVREVFGIGFLKKRATHLICIPTTAGTGAEVSPNAILLDEAERLKKGAVSPHLVPDLAVCDPDLTLTVPPAVTAATGIDALVHCMEAYANKHAHPAVDVYALEGIRRIGRSIERAVRDGADRDARADVMLGALYGGLCLGPVNTAAVHALSYPLGGEYRIAHGMANSLLMPHVFRFNLTAMPARYADIALALGCAPTATVSATAAAGLAWLVALSRACGIPQRLRDVGVPESDLPRLAQEAMKVTRLLKNNPRELTATDALGIYRDAY
ncbi:iron-containing alcohol dehydrogenase [Termitidicoccus mucosus]|uniref:Alcohol dehydrogenase n=1 Tax=Termitidicoccus mucosus TaxID=1184151 RepID=A0A178IMA5_9BACT|nr:alcohol dehydrogenase [Opitutaceae bacterium TSB47]